MVSPLGFWLNTFPVNRYVLGMVPCSSDTLTMTPPFSNSSRTLLTFLSDPETDLATWLALSLKRPFVACLHATRTTATCVAAGSVGAIRSTKSLTCSNRFCDFRFGFIRHPMYRICWCLHTGRILDGSLVRTAIEAY